MGIHAAMGEFPHKCPSFCSVPGAAAAFGCSGPLPVAWHEINLPDGSKLPLYECPHQMLRRTPDVMRFVNDFSIFVEHGTLPGHGGLHDQPAAWVEALGIAGRARAELLARREKHDD